MNLNKVVVAGRLGRDPELKSLPSGSNVANFTIASSHTYKNKNTGEKTETTEWFNCVAFGRTAEVIAQYFKKGKEIYVEGRLQTRSWEKDGKKNYRTEVIVSEFQFVGSDKSQSRQQEPDPNNGVDFPADDINPDDIPF